ncbi:MAG TPA: uroporphyrinogen-III C-methyltransferase [Noviherbaspirillum sp.]|uniref:uroporphyrinogen-III C-methyltransferase n=1 Tax=Noviherbaspirillum sp. TaxID=1926288 RepID=UPI002B4970A5|nr:uroporphyrinogen-III C-methyltransferase [Noviherbaspirillum sp.]HJV85563.1 uroporphyrinogen-III C-methyltransferase [Noviherbaspirillum sp.]
MNELPSSNDTGQSTQSGQAPQPTEPTASRPYLQSDNASGLRQALVPVYAGLGLVAILLAAQWWSSQHEIKGLREEVAQRLKADESLSTETKLIAKSVQDGMKELQAKVNVLESKQVEAQSQQLALEQLYQELSKNRDDWALAEIEQVLSTASQQLQLAGNVQGAIIALQNADSRLSRSDKPQFILIRRAIARDLERLKSLPTVDLTGIALRLDSVISQIDSMPLLSDEKPVVPATQPKLSRRAAKAAGSKAAAAKPSRASDWLADIEEKWNSWSSEMWTEIRQLIRVRNVDVPDALLLSPSQAYYARENLKLRLLNARMALLTRNEATFRNDMLAAQDAISRYFDTRARQTQATQTLLRQIQASNVSIEMPTLADSLNAVRNYKAKP